MTSIKHTSLQVLLIFITAIVTGCGGGGGGVDDIVGDGGGGGDSGGGTNDGGSGGDVSNKPALVLTPQRTKIFHFSWEKVDGATEYRLHENADGVSGFKEIARFGAETTTHDLNVYLPDRVNAAYLLEACSDAGCVTGDEIFVESSLAEAVGYLKASNPEILDTFGGALALSADGSTLVVGAPGEDSAATGINGDGTDNSALESGAVYVFVRKDSGWSQQAYIKAANAETEDMFGISVALSANGDTLAIGAQHEGGGSTGINGDASDNSAYRSGAVYIFRYDGAAWTQQDYIKASNTDSYDVFGRSLALSDDGNTLAVAALDEGSSSADNPLDNSEPQSGAAYIFHYDGTAWSQQAYIKESNPENGDQFGSSLALSGDGKTLAVVARNEELSMGTAYVFRDIGGVWSQESAIKGSNTEYGDYFGSSIALSANGDTLVVGVRDEESAATGINGDETDNSTSYSGAAYVFQRDGTSWSQQAYIKASNTHSYATFGTSVALSPNGNTLVVGAPGESSGATGINGDQTDRSEESSGAVYIFRRDGSVWAQTSYIKSSNPSFHVNFGERVALAADGKTLAVGEASGTGAVYLY